MAVKILRFAKIDSTYMSMWPQVHIYDELERHNCKVTTFNALEYGTPDNANEQLLRLIKKSGIDLFVTSCTEYDLFIETIEKIKSCGIATLLVCPDNLINPQMHLKIANHFDLVWLTARETAWMFEKIDCNYIFLPYAANPYLHNLRKEEVTGVGFLGTPYGSRANMINALTSNQIDVYCHYLKNKNEEVIDHKISYNYQNAENTKMSDNIIRLISFKEGRHVLKGALKNRMLLQAQIKNTSFLHKEVAVPPSDVYTIYSKYNLALSSTAARNTGVLKRPLGIVNLRSFEIPMAGGVQFCEYMPELAEYFEDEKEIIFYHGKKDMIEKARYYTSRNSEKQRQNIRSAARKRAETEHTWFCRFKKVFDMLGIKYDK